MSVTEEGSRLAGTSRTSGGDDVRILALDPATKCGFAHSLGASGVWDLSVRKDESSGMRLIRLRSKLDEFADHVDLVVYESARNAKHANTVKVLGQIQGVVQVWVEDHDGVEHRGYSPSEIKKHATGKGNASKEAMVAAAVKRWPDLEVLDDNHADALWLLDLAMSEYSAGDEQPHVELTIEGES